MNKRKRLVFYWNRPMVWACGWTWHDGPHYYLHLGIVGVCWSPWGNA